MVDFILSGIQNLVNLLFFVAIIGTIGVSWVYAHRLKKQYSADFPWNKTAAIVGIRGPTLDQDLPFSGDSLKRFGCQL